MKSCYRLKKNYQYNYVYNHAKSVNDNNLVLLYCKSNKTTPQAGFSISKKYGHAVLRNRLRRQLKAAVSPFMPRIKNGVNMVFIPKKSEEYNFASLADSVEKLLQRAGLLK